MLSQQWFFGEILDPITGLDNQISLVFNKDGDLSNFCGRKFQHIHPHKFSLVAQFQMTKLNYKIIYSTCFID